jgi:hypothetical protein
VAIFLLAGCLGYSNSAVNPILYAFLSDNFKKSFMKVVASADVDYLPPFSDWFLSSFFFLVV